MSEHEVPETTIILNPESGHADNTEIVEERAKSRGYGLERTAAAGDAIEFTSEAIAAGASTIVAAGGDGTVNEVVRGIERADAFDEVTLGILPLGTGNNFAKQIGITDIKSGFDILERGDRRRIDLGQADGHLFVNSCVAGLTAESSSETSPELKRRLGVLAYVITTFRSVPEFEAPHLTVNIDDGETATTWSGEALSVLVGNARRFSVSGNSQANMEDGLLDVTVIKDVPVLELMSDTFLEELLGRDSPDITRSQTPSLTISIHDPTAIRFSLDGEIIQQKELELGIRPNILEVAVGDAYDPDPE